MESIVYNVGPTWKGFPSIHRLIIFGDSYSSVDHLLKLEDMQFSSAADPLGVPFPGNGTMGLWSEPGKPNWVGHLITKYRPGPRYVPRKEPHQAGSWDDQSIEWLEDPLLVNDYARGGDTAAGVARQIRTLYLPGLGTSGGMDAAPWTAEGTLFVTWVGINDCAFTYREESLEELFALQDELYKTGARNFLFIDIPKISRSPAVTKGREEGADIAAEKWNLSLRKNTELFSTTHADCSIFLFSSFKLFNDLLDNLENFGFEQADAKRRGGSFWVDHIHPTSNVHDQIASSLAEFLHKISSQVDRIDKR